MPRTGAALFSIVLLAFALTWWLARTDDPEPPPRLEEPHKSNLTASASSVDAPPRAMQLDGWVLDAQQRTPIAGATLEFEGEGEVRNVVTGADGHFTMIGPEGAWVLASVNAQGYARLDAERVFERSTSGVQLELTRLPERRGRVVDQAGRPIEGALIQPWGEAEFAGREFENTLSDPRGEFRLVADAITRLEVSHLCCITQDVPVGLDEHELVITLEPAKIERVLFKGIVVDEDGKPVEGAKVSGVGTASEPEVSVSIDTLSGFGGRFEVEVPAKARIDLDAELGPIRSTMQTVSAQDEARLVLIEHASSFSGRVTNEAGEPLTRFKIAVSATHLAEEREFTSADGTYEFSGLPKLEGTLLMAEADGYVSSAPRLLRLARRQHLTDMDFVLTRGLKITGMVIDRETNHPLAAANVSVANGRSWMVPANARARTDSLGRFVLAGLKSGRIEARVTRSGYLSRVEVLDTANQAEVRIGLVSASSENAKEEYVGVGMRFASGKLGAGSGFLVSSLHPQGGAHVAGVLVGDEILAADGVEAGSVETSEFLLHIKGEEGTTVRLSVRRDGKTFDVHAVRRSLSLW